MNIPKTLTTNLWHFTRLYIATLTSSNLLTTVSEPHQLLLALTVAAIETLYRQIAPKLTNQTPELQGPVNNKKE